jgi:hypothetical protein
MVKTQLKKTDAPPDIPSAAHHAPKVYSAREHAAMGMKIVLVTGFLFGLLWLLDAMVST